MEQIWTAIVEVIAINDNDILEGAIGAFTNVAYFAKSKEDLIIKIEQSFNENNFEVLEVDDIILNSEEAIDYPEDVELYLLLNDLKKGGYDYSWGIFFTYDSLEEG